MNTSRAVIFANGTFSNPAKLKAILTENDRILCADAGAAHALALGLLPEIVVGDLDSIASETLDELKKRDVHILTHPCDQNKTDLDVTLAHALKTGATEILFLTSLGGRLDHMLANIMLASRVELQHIRISFFDGETYALFVHSGQSASIDGQMKDIISLVPFTRTVKGVTLNNVKWPLNKATLERGSTLTSSNVMTADKCTIQVEEGSLLLLHTRLGI